MSEELEQIEKEIFALKAKRQEIRKRIPPTPVREYAFAGSGGQEVALSALFGEKSDLLVVHNMGKGCAYCTLWADGLNGLLPHLEDRAAFVLASPDDPQAQAAFAAERGWKFRMISDQRGDFTREMGFMPGGEVYPGVSAFHKDTEGRIERVAYTWFGPGDDFCAVWPLFELLAEGVHGWEPGYSY